LNWIRGTNATAPTSINVKLHIGDPGAAAATAPAVGDATRKVATFAVPSAGAIALSNAPQWTNVSTTETLSHVSNWDNISAGNPLWTAALSSTQPWNNTNTFTLTTLGVSITPLMA
jgi:hypothetical protein